MLSASSPGSDEGSLDVVEVLCCSTDDDDDDEDMGETSEGRRR